MIHLFKKQEKQDDSSTELSDQRKLWRNNKYMELFVQRSDFVYTVLEH